MFSGRYATRQGTYEVVTLVCRVVIPKFGWDWGGSGGGNTEHALNKWFCAPNFLEITDVGEASLIFEKISLLPKVYSTNRPNRFKTLKCIATKYLSCFAIHLTVLLCANSMVSAH